MRNVFLLGVWNAMKQRCRNPRCKLWPHYGGRGIGVCPEWLAPNGFYAFQDWALGAGWAEGLTLDRTDNDGDYTPANCRFVTRAENLRNRRMTPAWRAAILKAQAASYAAPRTEKQRAAGRVNIAKARQSLLMRRMTPIRLEAMRANLTKARAARFRNRPEALPVAPP